MGIPMIDGNHVETENLAKRITRLCFSPEFCNLRRELEYIYGCDCADTARQAFQDALYTLMVQEEVEHYKARLLE